MWPTSATTGTTGTLTPDNRDGLSTSGATYTGMHFTGIDVSVDALPITGDGMTFVNCKFDSHLVVNEVDGCTLIDCEFPGGVGVSSSRNVTFTRCKLENFSGGDGFHITNDGVSFDCEDVKLEDCYLYNVIPEVESHSDGIQVRGSLRLWIKHCYIHMGPPKFEHYTALYLENSANGPNTDWLIEESYFKSGYGHTLSIGNPGGPGTFRYNMVAPAAPPEITDTEQTDLSTRPQTAYTVAAAPADVILHGNVDEDGDNIDDMLGGSRPGGGAPVVVSTGSTVSAVTHDTGVAFSAPRGAINAAAWPTSATTGTTGPLTDSALTTANVPGATYANLNFTEAVSCVADDVTFTNCRFAIGFEFYNCDNSSVVNCEFPRGMAFTSARSCVMDACKIENFEPGDGIHINWYNPFGFTTDCTIKNTYIYNSMAVGEAHSDAIQVRGSRNLTIDNCYVDMGPPAFTHNAALYFEPIPSNNGFKVTNSYFRNREGYTLYIHNPGGTGGLFAYNTVAAGGYGHLYALVPSDVSVINYGNVDENGAPLTIGGIYAPPITVGAGSAVAPATVATASAVGVPSVAGGSSSSPAPATLATAAVVGVPSVAGASSASPAPAALATVTTVGSPSVAAGSAAAPATLATVAAVGAPTVSTGGAPAADTIAAYAFNEGSGTTAAEVNGGVTLTGVPAWDTGRHGSSLRLNLTNGPTLAPYATSGVFTIMFDAYVFGPGTAAYNLFINDWDYQATLGNVQLRADGLFDWYTGTGTAGGYYFPTGQWVNVTLQGDGTQRHVYINGAHLASENNTALSGNGTLVLGGFPGYEPDIKLDNLRFFDRVLSAGEVATYAGTPVEPASTGDDATVAPARLITTAAFAAPALSTSSTVQPSTRGTTTTVAGPVVTVSSAALPATHATTTIVGAASVSTGARPTPASAATASTVGAAAVSTGAAALPATRATVASVGAPTVLRTAAAVPATHATTAAVGAPTVASGSGVFLAVTKHSTTSTVGAPAVSVGVRAAPATLATSSAVGTPVARAGVGVTPATKATTTTVGTPIVGSANVVSPATRTTASSFAAPTVSTGTGAAPARLATSSSVGAPALSTTARVVPATHATTAAVGAPAVGAGTGTAAAAATHQSAAAFGAPTVTVATVVSPDGVETVAVVGVPVITTGVRLLVGAVATRSEFGVPHVAATKPVYLDLEASVAAAIDRAASYAVELALEASRAGAIELAADTSHDAAAAIPV